MPSSLQDAYAKNLQQRYGYPLRTPEPSSNLPESYQKDGLQIGDVGYTDDKGKFHVLFNIRYSPTHELHERGGIPEFEPRTLENADLDISCDDLPPGRVIISTGINHRPQPDESRLVHKFNPSTAEGAILILPSGAACYDLRRNEKLQEFRKTAIEHALSWCKFAGHDTLYLVTGLYKTHSWSLGSFDGAPRDGEILVERQHGQPDTDAKKHLWKCTFDVDWRSGPERNEYANHTVFIRGFRIAVRWKVWASVDWVPHVRSSLTPFITLLASLFAIFLGWLPHISRTSMNIGHVPHLSQPFHPSDIINRYLLDKNPEAQVAVTHDSQWIGMLEEEGLTYEDLSREEQLRVLLAEKYTCDTDDNAVYIRSKRNRESMKEAAQSSGEKTTHPSPLSDSPVIVITHMRAENIALGISRIPVGLYLVVQFHSKKKKTKNKAVLLHEDVVILPRVPCEKIRLMICASFEFDPMLGNDEILLTREIDMEDMVGNMHLVKFSSGEGQVASSCPSLLMTLERRFCENSALSIDNETEDHEDSSMLAKATDDGHNAVFRYYKNHKQADLDESMEHFEHALGICPPGHRCRAAALFNLATAKFMNCCSTGDYSELVAPIALYRDALKLRPARTRHPDRPATLLHLAQALSYQYGTLGCEKFVLDEILELVTEIRDTCSEASHERRAADLIVQTCKQYQVTTFKSPYGLEKLVAELRRAARIPPENYFDRAHRLSNLSAALRRRFELFGDLGDLNESIIVGQKARQLLPSRPMTIIGAGMVTLLRRRIQRRGKLLDLYESIGTFKETEQFTPHAHIDMPWILTSLGDALCVLFEQDESIASLYRSIHWIEEATQQIPYHYFNLHRRLANLRSSLRRCFQQQGEDLDLSESVTILKNIVRHTPDDRFNKPWMLTNLGVALSIHFERRASSGSGTRAVADLNESICLLDEAVRLAADNHCDKPRALTSLGEALCVRFSQRGKLADLNKSIRMTAYALRLTPAGHPDRPRVLTGRGVALFVRSIQHGKFADLDNSISLFEEAVGLTPDDHFDKPGILACLGTVLWARFSRRGGADDLVMALSLTEEAVKLTSSRLR